MQHNTGFQKTTRTKQQAPRNTEQQQRREKARAWTRTDKRAAFQQ